MASMPQYVFEKHHPVVCRAYFKKDIQKDKPKTLHYFAIQGRGELPRLMLEYTQTPYNDVMYFLTDAYKEFSPFGQMPCYQGEELGEGVYLTESAAVSRHIARITGIAGKDVKDAALQDMLWEAGIDINDKKSALYVEETDAGLDGILKGLIKLQKDNKCLGTGNRAYGGDSPLGVGEIGVFHALYSYTQIKPEWLATRYPSLDEFVKAAAATPSLAAYLKSERRMPITENEIGKTYTGPTGYKWLHKPTPDSFKEEWKSC